ncbi:LexA family transcriptional regulator [bacterium SCSIO 12643]|nr:LexA family transcriptional regulator [bacterium SCSIO 12643]
MLNFASNIKYLRNKKAWSQQALADHFELSRGQIASYEDHRAEPSQETLIKYSDFFKLPIDALIRHDLTLSKDDVYIDIGKNRVLFPVVINNDDEDMIEVVPIKASAGYLRGYDDPEYISELPQMKLPFVPTGKHRAFPIKGDSMEPWVRDGAFVVGKFVESPEYIRSGQTYVVITRNEGLVYKRLYKNTQNKSVLIFKSDNAFYEPYEVRLEDVIELWEYTCKIDMQNYENDDLNLSSIMQMMRSFQVELKEIKSKMN